MQSCKSCRERQTLPYRLSSPNEIITNVTIFNTSDKIEYSIINHNQ